MRNYKLILMVVLFGLISGLTATEKFEPTVESLQNYECPEWFRDAKFGIYMHWGVYSVAEKGEWYARKLYEDHREEYQHHLKTYGHPSEFGYKDFIPMWKAENFDPDYLVGLFKEAGAKYFSPCAAHHDGFDLWNSKHNKYNAANMGPKKDLIGMFRKSALEQGLRFGVTTHLSRSYSWMNVANMADTKGPRKGVPYDGQTSDFYPPKHDDTDPRAAENPPAEWREEWKSRLYDLIDNYHPDILYFDCSVPFRNDRGKAGMEVISHLYNHSMDNHKGKNEAVMCIKERPFQGFYADGMTTLDYERGKAADILKDPWQTDDSMGPWGYRKGADYMSTDATIDKLIDIVSKNGNLLLNVPIRADGTLDEKTTTTLKEMGKWLKVNGEAIYDTRPWYKFGDGKTNEIPHKVIKSPYKWHDHRFTVKGDYLYTMILDYPPKAQLDYNIRFLAPGNYRIGEIKSVELLGHGPIKWEQTVRGLVVYLPKKAPCDYAVTLKILLPKK